MKLLLLANKSKWATWEDKISELKTWFNPKVQFEITLVHTNYDNVPLTTYSPGYQGIDPSWYDANISPLGKNFDIILFVLPLSQWSLTNGARGWRADRTFGAVELHIACDENEKTYLNGTLIGSTFFNYARHEILHALFLISGQNDTTHYWYGINKLENCLNELKLIPNAADKPSWFSIPSFNAKKDSLVKFCDAIKEHEGYFLGSRSYRNNNPGNLKYVGQRRAIGPDKGGFCVFKTYVDGFDTLYEMIERACTGKSKIYSPSMSMYDFFAKYAPSNDGNNPRMYAETVAKKIGVSPGVCIGSL